jgi:hypothetical protein
MHHQGSHRLILASVPLFLSSIRAQVVLVTTLCLIGSPVLAVTKSTKLKYAETRRVDQTDEYFGVKVPDPIVGWGLTYTVHTRWPDALPSYSCRKRKANSITLENKQCERDSF